MIEIPLTSEPSQVFNINLDNINYAMRVIYNTRVGIWSLDVESDDFTVFGTVLVGGVDIFKQHPGPLKNVIVVNVSDSTMDATADNLGSTVVLVILADEDLQT